MARAGDAARPDRRFGTRRHPAADIGKLFARCRIPAAPIVVPSNRPTGRTVQLEEMQMRYLMFVATDTEPDTSTEPPPDIEVWIADVESRGKWVTGDRLRPVGDAVTVRVRSGELLITDGPFTESKDWICGFDVLECDDLDEAIEIAAKHPMARHGRLELRPFWPMDEG